MISKVSLIPGWKCSENWSRISCQKSWREDGVSIKKVFSSPSWTSSLSNPPLTLSSWVTIPPVAHKNPWSRTLSVSVYSRSIHNWPTAVSSVVNLAFQIFQTNSFPKPIEFSTRTTHQCWQSNSVWIHTWSLCQCPVSKACPDLSSMRTSCRLWIR